MPTIIEEEQRTMPTIIEEKHALPKYHKLCNMTRKCFADVSIFS